MAGWQVRGEVGGGGGEGAGMWGGVVNASQYAHAGVLRARAYADRCNCLLFMYLRAYVCAYVYGRTNICVLIVVLARSYGTRHTSIFFAWKQNSLPFTNTYAIN